MKLTRNHIIDMFVQKTSSMNTWDTLAFLGLCFLNLVYVLYRKNILDTDDIDAIFYKGK